MGSAFLVAEFRESAINKIKRALAFIISKPYIVMRMHTTAAFTLTCLLNIIIVSGDAAFVSSTSIRRIPMADGKSFEKEFMAYSLAKRNLYSSSQGNTDTDTTIRVRPKRDYGPLGHDYLPAADTGPISPLVKLTEEQIHSLIARRLQCKMAQNYSEADQILSGLVAAGVYLQDKRKEWRADGKLSFGTKKIQYVRRGGPGQLSEDDLATVASMVERRARAKRNEEFHLSDKLSDALKVEYGVKVNDKRREWSINTVLHNSEDDTVDVYVPSPIAPKDDPTHWIKEESKAFIQARLTDRVVARKNKDYAMADAIRDELKNDYSVVIDDRTKEWKVVTSEKDAFASEAQVSQRSAFVRKNESSGLEAAFGTLFGDSAVEKDEEPDSSTPTIASVEDESVLAPKEKDALDEASHLSTLTVVVLKEKLRKAGLPVSGRKAELIERLLN
jgi:hypothetical protein